jgi:hypothetical protein
MQEILDILGHLGVVPVVKIEQADEAVPLGNALIAGGLPCAEITFRTGAAEDGSLGGTSREGGGSRSPLHCLTRIRPQGS